MYTYYLSSIRKAFRSSSPISLLARIHGGELTSPRPFSVVPKKFENSGDKLTRPQMDQDSITTAINVLTMHRRTARWVNLRSLSPSGFYPEEFSQIAIAIKNNSSLALRLFQWTKKKSFCVHNLSSYSTIIHILTRGGMRDEALILIGEAIRLTGSGNLESNSNPLKVLKSLVKTYTKCSSIQIVFDLLIEACLESKKIESAVEIARKLISRGIRPTNHTCNSLIERVIKSLGPDVGYDLYKEIFGLKNCSGSRHMEIFNTLMVGFYQNGALGRVKQIWNVMIRAQCQPKLYSYTILMASYCDEGNMEKAEYLWEKMRAKGFKLDVIAYNTIIGGYCQIGEVERAKEFLNEMWASEIESTSTTYEHLIKAHCSLGDADSAVLVYEDMISKGFRPEVLTINKLITGLSYGNRISEAMDIWRSATKNSENSGFCLTKEGFEVLIIGLCRKGYMEEALMLQAKMMCEGYEMSHEIYCALITGHERQDNSEMALKLKNEMLETGLYK